MRAARCSRRGSCRHAPPTPTPTPTLTPATAGSWTGTLSDGASYLIERPAGWNGTVLLWSHGYEIPGQRAPAADAPKATTTIHSSSATDWGHRQLDVPGHRLGDPAAIPTSSRRSNTFVISSVQPKRTIAWGHSLGGMITAGLIQVAPKEFTAALPMCGVVAGGVQTWNLALDSELAVQQLLGPTSALQIVNITDPTANLTLAEELYAGAQATPQGQARIALAAALGDIPGWFDPTTPEPAPTDYTAQEANQYLWATEVDGPFAFAFRAELEARAGGNPSWTGGVNFSALLMTSPGLAACALPQRRARPVDRPAAAELRARISADPNAFSYLRRNVTFTGALQVPVLTMHTTADGLVIPESESAYRNAVQAAGDAQDLRQTYVARAGHCSFTAAERLAALQVLVCRLDSGRWRPAR